MPFSAPTVMLLLVLLPFFAGTASGAIAPLVSHTSRHRRLVACVSLTGATVYLAGMIGLLPGTIALPLVLLGGCLVGLAFHDGARAGGSSPGADRGLSAYWRGGQVIVDWERFDRLRAGWASQRSSGSSWPGGGFSLD